MDGKYIETKDGEKYKLVKPRPRGQQWEARLVNEWLAQFHPSALQWKRVRLGAVPNQELSSAYKVILRWCDAVYIENDIVYILEAKLRPNAGAIGQLEHYQELFPRTPEFQAFSEWPVEMVLLSGFLDLEIKRLCMKKGIHWELFQPTWVKDYFKEKYNINL